MSEGQFPSPQSSPPGAPPLTVVPVQSAPRSAPRRPSVWLRLLRFLFVLAFGVSVALNALLLLIIYSGLGFGDANGALGSRYYSGNKNAKNKIAIVKIDGVLIEGLISYARRQITEAQEDDAVKAVVLRIDSPGGTITASDELYRQLEDLRDGIPIRFQGDPEHHGSKRPLVVSMGWIAASGGYYVAMPASHLVAERTTITGSIGVYIAFPNIVK